MTDSPATGARMSDEVLERFVRQYIEASVGPEVSFVWHGGEPSLAGIGFYQRAVELQKQYLPEGWVAWNNLQTNGILLDDEWCSFLADAEFDVGLSIDGTEAVHDRYRLDADGGQTYQAVVQTAERLLAHGVRPDLLCTVTSTTAADPLGVYRALRELNTGWIQFIPIIRRRQSGDVTPDSVSDVAYADFLCAVFDEWVQHDISRLVVQAFAEMARVWAGGSAGLCWMAPTCGRALIVEADGSVYSCDHYVFPEHRIGSILESHLGDLADSPEQLGFGADKYKALPKQCLDCAALAVCNGGCPKDRFLMTQEGEVGLNYLCQGLKRFFTYARPMVEEIDRLRRIGVAPAAIDSQMLEMAKARWKGVGRNDPCICGSGRKAKNCCWNRKP